MYKSNKIEYYIQLKSFFIFAVALTFSTISNAEVVFESQYKIADNGLFFNGEKVGDDSPNNNDNSSYDYKFGSRISAHGDAIKVYNDFIFTTWYQGGKEKRNLMLSRYNPTTGVVKTIEFPHQHTGFRGNWWVGESHNTAAVGISPKDGKIHLLYDMHSYDNSQFPNDYFRYSFTSKNAATVPDEEFTLALFVEDQPGDYGHTSLNGIVDPDQYSDLTYPTFFLNENNDLLFFMRTGGNNNGGYVFTKYTASTEKWNEITQFNHLNAASKSDEIDHNWGLYGEMKFVNGKLRTAFQTRSANNNDKYQYQNGIYYAYSDDQNGATNWKNHSGVKFNIPLANPAPLKIYEPGDLVSATGKNEVYIVGGFDFTVTSNEDVHIISKVQDKKNNVTKSLHSYKPNGDSDFTHSTDFKGADALYTSGKGVYIIGLNSGRPFVQRTNGGENNFVTVYESTVATSFSHGVPHIYQGKLYYYLQERGNSTSLPLHVQIIDLDLPPEDIKDVPPEGYTFAAVEGQNVETTDAVDIAFGAQNAFNFQYNVTQNVMCSSSVFGDPIPGVNKKCYTRPTTYIDTPSSDHSCTVAGDGFSPAQAKFDEHCPSFTRNRCERIETHNEWVICSNLPDVFKRISIVNFSTTTTIENEDYARAIDLSIGNLGDVYRDGDVDIISMTNGKPGYSVNQIETGESLSYDLLVTQPGDYEITINYASPVSNGSISIDIDGDKRISNQSLPKTVSSTDYTNSSSIIGQLNSGSQTITITVEQGGFNLNSFSIENVQGKPEVPDTGIGEEDKEQPETPNTDIDPNDKEESENGFNGGGGSINLLLLILMSMTLLINRKRF